MNPTRKKNTFPRIWGLIGSSLFLLVLLFFIWMAGYYPAEETATTLLSEGEQVTESDGVITITPDRPTDTAVIFYPGAQVDYVAYLPLLTSLANTANVTCYLIEMPFNIAFFTPDAAQAVMDDHPEVAHWYLAGHSLGGSMASAFASDHEEQVSGLILLGSYVYGDYPTADSLTIYGTFNDSLVSSIDYTDNIVVIEGGNHAQFGNYGRQFGDPDATITAAEQQRIAVEAITAFIDKST